MNATGQMSWHRKGCTNINVPKVLKKQTYYSTEAITQNFSSYCGQQGRGFGSLAAGVGTVAVPLAKASCQQLNLQEELLVQNLRRIGETGTQKTSPKKPLIHSYRKRSRSELEPDRYKKE